MVEQVSEKFNFSQEEEATLQFWKEKDCFQTSLKQSKNRPKYNFYDGPPFATGLPHYGHILAGTIKDIVTRWAHQTGFHVERTFGWDCHGLPVEYEIDKTLGIKSPDDVAKMGIAEYNRQCRAIVMRYSSEWESTVTRLGRWIDFKNDYKTMYPWFMESVWWVFKQLYNKGFVYRGFKVMPFSTGCHTPLSNFEAGQNYKDTQDPAVIVTFPLEGEEDVKLVAWTTTPWTLPSNLAVCVNPDMEYVKVRCNTSKNVYILMEARLCSLFKKEQDYEVLEKFLGKTLNNKSYLPLFNYFSELKQSGAFRVLCDGYVTDDSGTGVVHQAPFFGADDYRVCLNNGVFKKDDAPVCPIDSQGCFTSQVPDYKGIYVKTADKEIIKRLKAEGRLVSHGTTKHNYPFCWRSDTPLIYRAVPSWFVKVEQMRDQLLENNSQSYWVPDFVKEKRFGNWLRDARDWAISRNRYWGTPIPLWVSDDYEEIVCVGSIEELKELSGVEIKDLHRENVDHITIPSKMGKGQLHRISEVFDCWFESGSMPYAQKHYPFENKTMFEKGFPADFIAEGIDQTRGWFYTLLVLSTILFKKPAFKNLIVNGLVLASDGQKMSKRKKNYPDPMAVINKYGSDALRLYLINSPVVRAENLRFQEEGVRDILKDVFLPWYNAYRFLVQNIHRLQKEENTVVEFTADQRVVSDNVMDKWILSFSQSLVAYVKQEMAAYHLYTVVPRLVKFVDILTNWYVRVNRRRLKGENGADDCKCALQTLFQVVFTMIRVMAPFTPFLTEHMYRNLRKLLPSHANDPDKESVHYIMVPEPDMGMIDENIERSVSRMQSVIEITRVIRDRKTLPIKYPLPEMVVIHKDPQYFEDVKRLERYVLEELNVRNIEFSSDKDKYGVTVRAEPDHVVLGKRLKGEFKKVTAAIRKLTSDQCEQFAQTGSCMVEGHQLVTGDLRLIFEFSGKDSKYEAHSDNDVLVLLNVTPDQSMIDEGVAREVVNRVQKLRKKAHLVPTDQVTAYYSFVSDANDGYLASVIDKHRDYISSATKSPMQLLPTNYQVSEVIIEEATELKGSKLHITLSRGCVDTNNLPQEPVVDYVDVYVPNPAAAAVDRCVILCENPRGDTQTSTTEKAADLTRRICALVSKIDLSSENLRNLDGSDAGDNVNNRASYMMGGDAATSKSQSSSDLPSNAYVNVTSLNDRRVGTLLLGNPVGKNPLDFNRLPVELYRLFDQCPNKTKTCAVFEDAECTRPVSGMEQLENNRMVYVYFA